MTKKQRKILYPTILISGLFLMGWEINVYRNTIIDLSIPIGIILIVGIIAFVLDIKNYKKTYEYKGIGLYFYALMNYLAGYGFIACTIFMLTNYYLADKKSVKKSFEIVERSSLSGSKHHRDKRKPTFKINYDGKMKELVFKHKFYKKMASYKNIELEIKKGFFGFDIIDNKELK